MTGRRRVRDSCDVVGLGRTGVCGAAGVEQSSSPRRTR
jgi:hypothetical protein